MKRGLAALAALFACACAPGPAPMAASEASERLERFAAGSGASEVCTPEGRSMLRGAVRAYGAELARANVAWPALPEAGDAMRGTDLAVTLAFAAGFVEASDFQNGARAAIRQFALAQWPQFRDVRAAAQVACGQVVELQQAASRLAAEMERYEHMRTRADPERLRRQQERLQRAEAQLEALADLVEAEIAQARRG